LKSATTFESAKIFKYGSSAFFGSDKLTTALIETFASSLFISICVSKGANDPISFPVLIDTSITGDQLPLGVIILFKVGAFDDDKLKLYLNIV
jgi:hypothetical protein